MATVMAYMGCLNAGDKALVGRQVFLGVSKIVSVGHLGGGLDKDEPTEESRGKLYHKLARIPPPTLKRGGG